MKSVKELNEAQQLNESKESKDAIKLIQDFEKAFKDFTVGWMDLDGDDILTDNAVEGFPFNESLDELYNGKLKPWAKKSISNLKKVD